MTARVINDPSSLGWEYDPDTGRWTWGGGSSSGGGDGTFPEAPVNGLQYARQNAGWSEIVHPEGGDGTIGTITTADVQLTNPTLRSPIGLDTQEDANTYFYNELGKLIDEDGNVIGGGGGIEDAPTDGAIYGRKNAGWVVVPTSGGGEGPDMSLYYTGAQCDQKYQPKGNYLTSGSLNGYATETWVGANYQPKGNYLTSFTESDPTVPAHVKSITQTDIDRWDSSGGGYDGADAVKLTGAQTISGRKLFTDRVESQSGLIAGGNISGSGWLTVTGDVTANKFIGDGASYSVGNGISISSNTIAMTGSYTGNFSATGTITGTDCIATSDERLKDNITTAPLGLIDHLKGREWDWLETREKGSGVVAQELEKVLPHLVHEDDEGMKSVSYNGLVAYLIEEVKALKAEVEELRNA